MGDLVEDFIRIISPRCFNVLESSMHRVSHLLVIYSFNQVSVVSPGIAFALSLSLVFKLSHQGLQGW